ncbi:MAG: hypothetical protein ACRELF_01065 [Gemmataceae bacterium]
MIFSLPSYRRLSEVDLDRLRRDEDRDSSNRVARVLFNLLLLMGLWGVPLYARWVLLSDVVGAESLPKAALGKWWKDDKAVLEFTADQQLRLIQNGALIESADYWMLGDTLNVSDFKSQPGNHRLPVSRQCFHISIRDDRLDVTPATTGFTAIPEKAWVEGSSLRLVLPAWHGATVQFRRGDVR